MRAEVEGVGLGQRHSEAIAIDRAQVGRVAVADPWDVGARIRRRSPRDV
jgi:hypothetical protein